MPTNDFLVFFENNIVYDSHGLDQVFSDTHKIQGVKSELARIRVKHSGSGEDPNDLCKANLPRYDYDLEAEGKLDDYPNAKQFVICVFSTHVTAVKAESLFSVIDCNKRGSRRGLKDSP
jgi:hypothetical protein